MREEIRILEDQLQELVFGQKQAIRHILTALFAGGHVLLQGVPGVGKTRLARALTHLIGGTFGRVQFTPDLMPSDIVGNAVFDVKSGDFVIHRGPIFANILLADEINRTPPKTQAALLEAMEERQVSIYGETQHLPVPFFVIATQNPLEYEGTYALPEAQLDRFMMQVEISYPAFDAELLMLKNHKSGGPDGFARLSPVMTIQDLHARIREVQQVKTTDNILSYMVKLSRTSRDLEGVTLGASPRAATALLDAAKACAYLEGRDYVIPDDVLDVVKPVLRHRLILHPNAELEGVNPDEVVDRVLATVEVPR